MNDEINPAQTVAEPAEEPLPTPLGHDDMPGDGLGASGSFPVSDSRPTIEQRYEIETTLVGLGLEDDEIGVPIGLLDRYVLRKLLGRGSMGAVFLAEDVELQRNVAIKVVARRIESARQRLRLRREARALASIDHENVLKVFDLGSDGEELFFAMEHVAGENLRRWQKGRGVEEVFDAYLQAGRGLVAAHAEGLVHRDFKPDNVMVDERDGLRVRVGDFGLVGSEAEGHTTIETTAAHGLLTSADALLGTLPYMAPEQLQRKPADARSDQHQFCVALWEAVAGQRPFGSGGRPLDGDTTVPARPPTMPRWAYPVLRRGLAFVGGNRYPNMDALLAALVGARRWWRVLQWGAAVGLAAGVLLVGWWMMPEPCQDTGRAMEDVWAPEVRAQITSAYEDEDGRYIATTLDRATSQWSEESHALCMARLDAPASSVAQLDDRGECLEQRAYTIEQRIETLLGADLFDASTAIDLITELDDGIACELSPIPIESSIARMIEHAEAAELQRDLDGALQLATDAVSAARDWSERGDREDGCKGDPESERSSELAAALFRLGHIQSERHEDEEARASLNEAHLNAFACGDEYRDAEARVHLAKLLALDFNDVDEATDVLFEARVALRRVNAPKASLWYYHERMAAGIIAVVAQDYDDARRYAQQGIEALGEPADPFLHAQLEINIGTAFHGERRYEEAAEAYGVAAGLVEDELGAQHPRSLLHASWRSLDLGIAAQESGDFPMMRKHLQEAMVSGDADVQVRALTSWVQGEVMDADDSDEDRRTVRNKTAELRTSLSQHRDGVAQIVPAYAELTAGMALDWLGDPEAVTVLEQACEHWTAIDERGFQTQACHDALEQARSRDSEPAN